MEQRRALRQQSIRVSKFQDTLPQSRNIPGRFIPPYVEGTNHMI
jgi:hypothetical protein